MSNPYRELFNAPGALGFALAGFLARMPISMGAIGLITMLAQLRGSYGLAAAVAAVFTLTTALLAPQVSRLVDRHGQGKVLPYAAAVSTVGMLALLLCSYLEAPDWTLFIFAMMAGCLPSMPAMVRARWTVLYRGRPQLQTAYALESVLDEVCFIAGPPLSVGLSIGWFPQAGPLVAASLLVIGVTAFVLQKATEPPVQLATGPQGGSVLWMPGVRVLALMLLAMGAIAGAVDVVCVAFAQHLGRPGAASLVLSVYAVGSCAAGLLFGALRLSTPLPKLFLWGGVATALATLPLLFPQGIASLAMAVLIAGMFFAPSMIVCMSLVERMVPADKLTEGMTWLITGLGTGVAAGAVLAGHVVDVYGAPAGFGVALAAGLVVLSVALYGQPRLSAVLGACGR